MATLEPLVPPPQASNDDVRGAVDAVPVPWLRGTVLGLLAVAALTATKVAFADVIGDPTPFLLYFGAVLVAAWYGGMPAGLVTTVASAGMCLALFVPDPIGLLWSHALPQVTLFVVEGVAITTITARLAAERRRALSAVEDARTTAAKLDVVLRGITDGITLQDRSGTVIYANEQAARLIGYASAEELLHRSATELARLDLRDEQGRPIPREDLPGRVLLRGGEARDRVLSLRPRGSTDERWITLQAKAVLDQQGSAQFIVNVFRDVTGTRRQSRALAVSQEWFSTALTSIGDAVIATDAEGRVKFLNPVAEALTKWTSRKAAGHPLPEVFPIIDETTRTPANNPVDRVLREGIIVGLTNHSLLVRPDGTEVAIDDSAAPIRDHEGKLVGVILVFRDVGRHRREEQRRAFLARATEELNSSLDYEATLATVARLAVPTIADWCAVDVLHGTVVRRLAVAHVDPAKVQCVQELERRYPPDPNATSGVPEILRTGRAEFLAEIPVQLLDGCPTSPRMDPPRSPSQVSCGPRSHCSTSACRAWTATSSPRGCESCPAATASRWSRSLDTDSSAIASARPGPGSRRTSSSPSRSRRSAGSSSGSPSRTESARQQAAPGHRLLHASSTHAARSA